MEAPGEQEAFGLIPSKATELIEFTAFNFYGDRMAQGTANGKIIILDRTRDGTWVQNDSWGAHSSEVSEVHWFPPAINPGLICSISMDGRFKIWAEDKTAPLNSGRRWNGGSNRPVYELRAPKNHPWYSCSIKWQQDSMRLFVALLSRNGELWVYESDNTEHMTNWFEVDRLGAAEKPERGAECHYKVRFENDLTPCYAAIREGMPEDTLGVIVGGLKTARIFRTKKVRHEVSLGQSSDKEFYVAAELPHPALVTDVAWSKGGYRGFDVVATGCKDGFVRVYQIDYPTDDGHSPDTDDYQGVPEPVVTPASRNTERSGISAGLAGARSSRTQGTVGPGHIKHDVKKVGEFGDHRYGVWKVEFDYDGQLLTSTDDDGKVMFWRREPSGTWYKQGQMEMNMSP